MPAPRKIAVFPHITQLAADAAYRVWQPGNPNVFVATPAVMAEATGVDAERAARVAADDAEQQARIAADNQIEADLQAEATARQNADNAEASARSNADTTLQSNLNAESNARAAGDTAGAWANLDFSGLPSVDPGGGRPWLSGGFVKVGP